ncbi:MATE family efflux transporter [Acutalibacter muris]|uniref:MATE family efflux transporter n=1 Tax=Acutalibacter muris TaxID=1796620 RepID=UPI0026F3F4F1|nr:MATE family efflux transporter [Acutalibacter muris]
MSDTKEKSTVFDTEHLVRTYFAQALPVVFSMIISLIYNLADTYFVARTGSTLIVAGVSVCAPVFTVLMAFGNVYAQGGSSLISRLMGKNDQGSVRRVSSFCFYLAIATGLVLAVPMLIFQGPILRLLGASPEVMPYAREYYLVLAAGAPAVILPFIHSNLLRCEGASTLSMLGNVGGSVINIILDPIFIQVLGMGAAGAAIATVIGNLASDLFFLAIVLGKSRHLSVAPRDWRVSAGELRQIFSVGITAAVTNIASSVCVVVTNQFLKGYGDEKIAAWGIASKVAMIAQMVLIGLAFGGVPLFGYLYGGRDFKKLKKLISFCTAFISCYGLLMALIIILLARPLTLVFMDDPGVVRDSALMLRWQVSGSAFAGIVLLFTCLFQATGKAGPALALSLSRQGLLFLAVLGVGVLVAGFNGLLAAQPIADALSAALAVIMWRAAFRKEGLSAA